MGEAMSTVKNSKAIHSPTSTSWCKCILAYRNIFISARTTQTRRVIMPIINLSHHSWHHSLIFHIGLFCVCVRFGWRHNNQIDNNFLFASRYKFCCKHRWLHDIITLLSLEWEAFDKRTIKFWAPSSVIELWIHQLIVYRCVSYTDSQ